MTRSITPERWSRIESVLHAALERPADERPAFLDRECEGDPELRREVASLLDEHARPGAIDRVSDEVIVPMISRLERVQRVEHQSGERVPRAVGHYELLEYLGAGGMGVLYTARDTRLQRTVALKFLPAHLSADAGAKKRFMVEARAAAALEHPNVCTVHEIGETEDGQLYIAMPLYDGQTLKRLIADGPLPVAEALGIAVQVARGLAKAHEHGIVHRDVKPSNVLVTADGVVKILDFGIAKLADVLTGGGAVMGTVGYMSPEQARGEAVDQRTDVWSVGAVLYEMLTGRRAFPGDDTDEIRGAVLAADPERIAAVRPDAPPALDRVVRRALAKQREARYGSMRELARDLVAIGACELEPGVASAERALPERSGRVAAAAASASARRRRVGALALAATAVAAASLVFAANRGRRDNVATALDPTKIVVVPFRVTGVDPSLRYLGEGVVDLLAAKLSGEGGQRAVDPRTAISTWNRVTAGQEGTADDARQVARSVGAGQALLGTLVGLPGDRLTITANVISAGGEGAARPAATVTGSADSLLALLDQIVTQLLAREAGVAERTLGALTSYSVPAQRAYLAGRAEYRRGHEAEAVRHFSRALEIDSTFALAALDLVVATGRLLGRSLCPVRDCFAVYVDPGQRVLRPESDQRQYAEAVQIAWRHRDRLSARDRPLLAALRGERYPQPSNAREMLTGLERATNAAPDRAETQYLLGTLLLHQGPALELTDSRARAAAALRRALELDSAYVAPIAGLVEVAALDADTAELRRMGALYLSRDSTGATADYVRWRVAAGVGDAAALSTIRAGFDTLPTATLQQIAHASQMSGVALEDAERASALVLRRAVDPFQRSSALFQAYLLALNRGRPREAARLLRLRREVQPTDYPLWERALMDALFWDGDTALAEESARAADLRLARDTLQPPAEVQTERPGYGFGHVLAARASWDLFHGDTARAAAGARWLRRHIRYPVVADLTDALLAARTGRADAAEALARAESVALEGCCGNAPSWINMELARAYELAGRDADALRAVRRGVWRFPPVTLSTSLREEGRLAAKLGDRAAAIRAYRHYLALRSDPEPSLRPQADSVRAELVRLERSSLGGGRR